MNGGFGRETVTEHNMADYNKYTSTAALGVT